jgi:hypothetical protein
MFDIKNLNLRDIIIGVVVLFLIYAIWKFMKEREETDKLKDEMEELYRINNESKKRIDVLNNKLIKTRTECETDYFKKDAIIERYNNKELCDDGICKLPPKAPNVINGGGGNNKKIPFSALPPINEGGYQKHAHNSKMNDVSSSVDVKGIVSSLVFDNKGNGPINDLLNNMYESVVPPAVPDFVKVDNTLKDSEAGENDKTLNINLSGDNVEIETESSKRDSASDLTSESNSNTVSSVNTLGTCSDSDEYTDVVEEVEYTEYEEVEVSEEPEPVIKKKRGRKPKAKVPKSSNKNSDHIDNSTLRKSAIYTVEELKTHQLYEIKALAKHHKIPLTDDKRVRKKAELIESLGEYMDELREDSED